ncbi:MAG: SRPBCC family protein [Egibacteraceae bacterium]
MGAYRFLTTWRLEAPVDEVWAALHDAATYPRWWPGFEDVDVLRPGTADGVGRRVRITMRGRLPYRLRFEVVGRAAHKPDRAVLDATGSLQGTGRWELRHDDGVTTMTYSWEVATTTAWMNVVEPFARPAFIVNHHAAMRRGAEGLARHLGSRLLSATSVPAARGRDWVPLAGLLLGMAGVGTRLQQRLRHRWSRATVSRPAAAPRARRRGGPPEGRRRPTWPSGARLPSRRG